MYDPGQLDQLIDIQRETLLDDGMGGQIVTYETIATDVWAHVRPVSGRELERYERVQVIQMVRFVVRFRNDIKHDDRIIWQGDVFNIRYIPPATGRESFLEIDAERGVAS